MPFQKGGRADKQGNSYEIDCIIYEMLQILNENNYSVVVEALGEDEIGTDILVTNAEGQKEHQQCKARNASDEQWNFYDLKSINVFSAWKIQLDRDCFRKVALVSPLSCSFLVDLHNRACNTSDKAEDFYSIQIMTSSTKFQNFYHDFCTQMGLKVEGKIENKYEILRSIDYLRRISYKQKSEYELREHIYQYIGFLFSSKVEEVYNAFVSLIVKGDILGKEITQTNLTNYFEKQGIIFRLIDGDKRVKPKLRVINQEYKDNFKPLQGGLVHRKVFENCINAIENQKSVIISGNAGYGKSGCTEAILNYCEEQKIPYIAIKLDRRTPSKSCAAWGQELGFPSSIVHSIHCISKNENAVIILDQLDALRWTQANSSEALGVCMELIREIRDLNSERKKKLIPVFVCRTYDLENDNNIKSLFNERETSEKEWEVVKVNDFEDSEVEVIVGRDYERLSPKLKKLLKIPSNLYIWQHLDKEEDYDDCLTASHLIGKWFEQICEKSLKAGLSQGIINQIKQNIVDVLDGTGRLFVPKSILNIEKAILDFLISSEIILVQNNKVGFVHQSILDYFISQSMSQRYFKGQTIEEIIGDKSKQNPSRRYQVQMFLQDILEYDSHDFLLAGEKMILSDNIRYYVKHIFYEILGQVGEPDDNIISFILANCENDIYGNYLINNTIFGKRQYISVLRNHGVLERWYLNPDKKVTVFNLLQSIMPDLEDEDIFFIKQHAFKNTNDDEQFMRCVSNDIMQDSEEMFELRMMFYEKYPAYVQNIYIDVIEMMQQFEERAIRIISFFMKNKIKSHMEYFYEEELEDSANNFLVNNGEMVLDELLMFIPKESGFEIKYGDWAQRHFNKSNMERICVELVKKATIVLIAVSPDCFWSYYEPYLGKGYPVFNEIILTGLAYMPFRYSNRIIHYLATDLNNNIFDDTSGAEDELGLVEEVLKVHAQACDQEELLVLEEAICKYISPNASEWYKRRIEKNKKKDFFPVYWSFWGDLQYKLLQCLPQERLSIKAKDLLNVLHRKFYQVPLRYSNSNGHSGWVKSPVSGKKIGKEQWLQIITNDKLKNRKQAKWVEVEGGFIESSYETFADDFHSVVRQNPQEMIEIVLGNKERVLPAFVDTLFSGVEFSEKLEKVDFAMIEKLLLVFPCDMKSRRAFYFCGIIEKISRTDWSMEIIEQLMQIALNHNDPELDKPNVTNREDKTMKSCEMLQYNAWNCVRGSAARAIGHLLWKRGELFSLLKSVIGRMTKDENPAVCFSTFSALLPSYNIEREWTEEEILYLYESDIRMVAFHDSKNILFRLYPKHKEKVIKIIEKCFESEDAQLVKVGGHAACEFYLHFGEFEKILLSTEGQSEEQIKSILNMAIAYLKVMDYREMAKNIILNYKNINMDLERPLFKIFHDGYVDAERDRQFLHEIMNSRVSRRIVGTFVRYLERNECSIVDYSDIILSLCENILRMDFEDLGKQWGIENEISKLIILLYDETASSMRGKDKQIAKKCLDLWDIMFEREFRSVRELSRKLMER